MRLGRRMQPLGKAPLDLAPFLRQTAAAHEGKALFSQGDTFLCQLFLPLAGA